MRKARAGFERRHLNSSYVMRTASRAVIPTFPVSPVRAAAGANLGGIMSAYTTQSHNKKGGAIPRAASLSRPRVSVLSALCLAALRLLTNEQ
jgi:hypothetical protein